MLQGHVQSFAKYPKELRETYRLIHTELQNVEELILRELSSEDPMIHEVVKYGVRLGGKRMRPALVLLSGKVFGPLQENHYRTAAVLEMIHTATLIHDDILDGAKFRRHLETMNLRWNTGISVLAGDIMFTRAMRIATESEDIFVYRNIAEATRRTCEAELKQVAAKGRMDLSREEYFSMISGKTAALLSCSCLLGAYFSGAEDSVRERFGQFGEKIGLAFQIVDDVLDLIGEEQVVGKTLGTDLVEGKLTLPLLLFLDSAPGRCRDSMLRLLREDPKPQSVILEIRDTLKDSGAVDSALNIAGNLVDSAIGLLDSSTFTAAAPCDCNALSGLFDLAKFVVSRRN